MRVFSKITVLLIAIFFVSCKNDQELPNNLAKKYPKPSLDTSANFEWIGVYHNSGLDSVNAWNGSGFQSISISNRKIYISNYVVKKYKFTNPSTDTTGLRDSLYKLFSLMDANYSNCPISVILDSLYNYSTVQRSYFSDNLDKMSKYAAGIIDYDSLQSYCNYKLSLIENDPYMTSTEKQPVFGLFFVSKYSSQYWHDNPIIDHSKNSKIQKPSAWALADCRGYCVGMCEGFVQGAILGCFGGIGGAAVGAVGGSISGGVFGAIWGSTGW